MKTRKHKGIPPKTREKSTANKIRDEGAISISKALKVNATLSKLGLARQRR